MQEVYRTNAPAEDAKAPTLTPIRAWKRDDLAQIYHQSIPDLLYQAQGVHRQHHDASAVQFCTLLSVKTGGCPEDCAYCPQAARYHTGLKNHGLLPLDEVVAAAKAARASGSTRFCMGAAWREVRDGRAFEEILKMVRAVASEGMEVCTTLGMLTPSQAQRLQEAGVRAYNHNLDTGPEHYPEVVGTRTYQDRLQTLRNVQEAGMQVCCGGIVGMGEELKDRLDLLSILSGFDPQPESVPINALVAVKGTPLEDQAPIDPMDMVRMIATARIALPRSRVRLSAGRTQMSDETQALCFLAGANSLFVGNVLLTTANPAPSADQALIHKLGMRIEEAPPEYNAASAQSTHLQLDADSAAPNPNQQVA